MTGTERICVFLGSRENAARAYSRLVAGGIEAQMEEPFDSDAPYAMGGPGIASVFVSPEQAERAKAVLVDVGFE